MYYYISYNSYYTYNVKNIPTIIKYYSNLHFLLTLSTFV